MLRFKLILIFLFISTWVKPQSPEQELSKTVVNHLANHRFKSVSKVLDKETRKQLKPLVLKKMWENVEQSFGPYQHYSEPQAIETDGKKGTETTIQFEKNSLILKLYFEKNLVSGMWLSPLEYRLPDEARNLTFGKEQVTVQTDSFELPAELIIPRSCSQCPVVVLVHGSGPNDMDESIGPNKVFKDLALMLAARGVATLRYDKRSKMYPDLFEKGHAFSIYDETVNDALSAITLARSKAYIDSTRIFILGHSLGAYAAPLIANEDRDLAGAILLAGPERPVYELLPDQYRFILGLDGHLSRKEQKMIKEMDQAVNQLRNARPGDEIKLKTEVGYWPASFFTELSDFSPAGMMDTIDMPFLVLQGEKDYQVSYEKDYLLMKSKLEKQPNPHIEFVSFPETDHLMMDSGETSEPADYFIPRNVRPEVIEAILNWISTH